MKLVRAAISVCSLPPCGAGQSHVEILDSNRACESAAGFQSCAHDPISIPMLRPFAENWPHAIALPPQGGRERTEFAPRATSFRQIAEVDQRAHVGALLLEAGLDLKRLHLLERVDVDPQ